MTVRTLRSNISLTIPAGVLSSSNMALLASVVLGCMIEIIFGFSTLRNSMRVKWSDLTSGEIEGISIILFRIFSFQAMKPVAWLIISLFRKIMNLDTFFLYICILVPIVASFIWEFFLLAEKIYHNQNLSISHILIQILANSLSSYKQLFFTSAIYYLIYLAFRKRRKSRVNLAS